MGTQTTVSVNQIMIPLTSDPARAHRGDAHALAADLTKNGMLQPILVTKDLVLLDGARRLALQLSSDKVQVYIPDNMSELFQALEKAAHPLQEPWDARRIFDLHVASQPLRHQEKAESARRAVARSQGKDKGPVHPRGWNPSRKWMAKITGKSEHFIQLASYMYYRYLGLVPINEENRELLNKMIAELEAGGNIFQGSRRFAERENEKQVEDSPDRVQRASDQRRLISESVSTLRGVSRGLAMLTSLNDKITVDEAEAWKKELNDLRGSLNQTLKKLRERISRTDGN